MCTSQNTPVKSTGANKYTQRGDDFLDATNGFQGLWVNDHSVHHYRNPLKNFY
jgi:hypothetical protein